MMHVVPCERVREDLAAYHDGELSIEAQVGIHSHLLDCVACRLEAAALVELSGALRDMAGAVPGRAITDSSAITTAVLDRIRVEDQLSLATRAREWFQDMHFVWAGLGASLALAFCIVASAGVLQAASRERPDSLAGIISTIASGATDPVRLVATADTTDRLLDTTEAWPAGESTDLMLSAFVTRDGRIQNVAVLEEEARTLRVKPEVVLAMVDAASRARFSPAHASGFPGGFNVVWLVTSTTVRGLPDYDLYLLSPPRLSTPLFGPTPPRKAAPVSEPSAKHHNPAAGTDASAG